MRRRIGLAALMTILFGGLTGLAVAAVLATGLFTTERATAELLRDRAELGLGAVSDRLGAITGVANQQLDYLAMSMAEGRVRIDGGDDDLGTLLLGALAGAPHLDGLAFIHPDGRAVRVTRSAGKPMTADWHGRPEVMRMVAAMRDEAGPLWLPPVWSPVIDAPTVLLRRGVTVDGRYAGLLVAAIRTSELSQLVDDLSRRIGVTAFILYGGDKVLAHPSLISGASATPDHPVPALGAVNDPALAQIWDGPRDELQFVAPLRGASGHSTVVDGRREVFFYRMLDRPGSAPWTIGIHLSASVVAPELRRLLGMAIAGIVMLLLSVGVTILAAQRLARPVRMFASVARRVGTLELQRLPTMRGSRVEEFDEAARAFNAMASALRWLETYVPRALVARLLARRHGPELSPEKREMTVMFTDIVAFSRFAEHRPADEVARFLNDHFTLVGACIEGSGGTIDKYVGDGVMAFWGAPGEPADAAARACRAALEIANALAAENARRAEAGEPRIRVRIGFHYGPTVVGNIGMPGRIDYTVVGDTVNVAQRLEQLGREIDDGADAVILTSAETVAAAGGAVAGQALGEVTLRGREDAVAAIRLGAGRVAAPVAADGRG